MYMVLGNVAENNLNKIFDRPTLVDSGILS